VYGHHQGSTGPQWIGQLPGTILGTRVAGTGRRAEEPEVEPVDAAVAPDLLGLLGQGEAGQPGGGGGAAARQPLRAVQDSTGFGGETGQGASGASS